MERQGVRQAANAQEVGGDHHDVGDDRHDNVDFNSPRCPFRCKCASFDPNVSVKRQFSSSCYQTGHFPTMYMVITNFVVAIVVVIVIACRLP